jgi:hypothetical protein
MLVNGAELDRQVVAPERHQRRFQPRCPIDDHELGAFQPEGIAIVEELALCRATLATHIHDGKQDLLPVTAHADGRQN